MPMCALIDQEVVSLRAPFDEKGPLDEFVREGARRMLQLAIDSEAETFVCQHDQRRDDREMRLVVKKRCRSVVTQASSADDESYRVDIRDEPRASPEVEGSIPVIVNN